MWLQKEPIEERKSASDTSSVTENEDQLLCVAQMSLQCISVKAMSMHYIIEFARISKRNSTQR